MIREKAVLSIGRAVALAGLLALAAGLAHANPNWTAIPATNPATGLNSAQVYRSNLNPPTNSASALSNPLDFQGTANNVIDALSFGDDPVCCANVTLYFSVNKFAAGAEGSDVEQQSGTNGPAGDVFSAVPSEFNNTQAYDSTQLGLAERVNDDPTSEDDMVSLELDYSGSAMRYPCFFSLAPGSGYLTLTGWSAADILMADTSGEITRYRTAAQLGLASTDNIDALAMNVTITDPENPDSGPILFSLSSASAATYTNLTGGDVLTPGPEDAQGVAQPYKAYTHQQLGLGDTDEMDGLDVKAGDGCGGSARNLPADDRVGETLRYPAPTTPTPPDILSVASHVTGTDLVVTINFTAAVTFNQGQGNSARLTLYMDEDLNAGTPDPLVDNSGLPSIVQFPQADLNVINPNIGAESKITIDTTGANVDVEPTDGSAPTRQVGTQFAATSASVRFHLADWPPNGTIGLFIETRNQQARVSDIVPDCGYFQVTFPGAPLPEAGFPETAVTFQETDGDVQVQVSVPEVTDRTIEIGYAARDLTATNGADYDLTTGVVTIPIGDADGFIDLTILDDNRVEGNETFEIFLFDPSNATLGANSVCEVTIVDDEPPPVEVGRWDFTNDGEGWADGTGTWPFARAELTSEPGHLMMGAVNDVLVVGIYERSGIALGVSAPGTVYRVRGEMFSNLPPPAVEAQEVRLRANFESGQQSANLDISSLDGTLSPTTGTTVYDLYVQQIGNETQMIVAVDLLDFSFGADSTTFVLFVDSVAVHRIPPALLDVLDANVAQFGFATSEEGWAAAGNGFFGEQPPLFTTEPGRLKIQGQNLANFGFWDNSQAVAMADHPALFRATFQVASDQLPGSEGLVPTLRMRASMLGMTSLLQIDSTDAGANSPNTTPRNYNLFILTPAQPVGPAQFVGLAYDLLNIFNATDDPNGSLLLDNVLVQEIDAVP